jgi:isocitrate dehydrogenase
MANPSGLLMGSLLMLEHLGQNDTACKLYNAWAKTIEDGIHTYDIYKEGLSKKQVGTQAFARAVITRLGQVPTQLKPRKASANTTFQVHVQRTSPGSKVLKGVDLFLESQLEAAQLAQAIQKKLHPDYELKLIANRGVGVWPKAQPETLCIDHPRLRIMAKKPGVNQSDLLKMLEPLCGEFSFSQIHMLFDYEGKAGYTLGQSDQ